MGVKKGNRVVKWIRTHKYWTHVIVLFIVLMLPVVLPMVRGVEGNEQYGFVLLGFWLYALVGGIIWSILAKKRGLTLLTVGSFLAVLGLFGLLSTLPSSYDPTYDFANMVLWGFPTLLGMLFLFSGIKRYSKRLEPRTVQQVEKVIMPTKVFHEQVSMKEPEVKKPEKTTLAERLPKIYKIVGIVFIVFGVLTLLWSILFTILGYYEILLYLMGALITGFGFWYYFCKSKSIRKK